MSRLLSIPVALALAVACGGSSRTDLLGGSGAAGGSGGSGGSVYAGGSGGTGATGGSGTGGTAAAGAGGGAGAVATGGNGGASGGSGGTSFGGSGGTSFGGSGGVGGSGASGGVGGAGGTGNVGGTGGSGGTHGTGPIACGSQSCDGNTHFCCVFLQGPPSCTPLGQTCQQSTDLYCDGPADCPGQVCCGHRVQVQDQQGNTYTLYNDVMCEPSCNDVVFCGNDPSVCTGGLTCGQSSIIPYNVCRQ